jgi:excisionase family DNA binding protein
MWALRHIARCLETVAQELERASSRPRDWGAQDHSADFQVARPAKEEAFLTLEEVSERLRFSKRWVFEQIKSGGLPYHRPGRGQYRFLWSEVESWTRSRD